MKLTARRYCSAQFVYSFQVQVGYSGVRDRHPSGDLLWNKRVGRGGEW